MLAFRDSGTSDGLTHTKLILISQTYYSHSVFGIKTV